MELLEIDWYWLLLRLHVDQEALYLALNESLRGRKLGSLGLVVPGYVGLKALHPGHEFAASVSRNQLVLGFDRCQLGDDPGSHLVDLVRDARLLDGIREGDVIGISSNLIFEKLTNFLHIALVAHWWCGCDDERIKVFLN